jgi:hypothetical protein
MNTPAWLAAAGAVLVTLPLAFLAWRAVGTSLRWRRWPGWTRLTRHAAMERWPDVDAVGARLVYEAIPGHRYQVRMLDLASGAERVLSAPDHDARRPHISADGRVITWESIQARSPRRSALVRYDVVEGRCARVNGQFDHVRGAALDAQGRVVLVAGARDGRLAVVRLVQREDGASRLLPAVWDTCCPCLDHSGTRAAALTNARHAPAQRFEPCTVDLPSGSARVLEQEVSCRGLCQSADGRWLAWEADAHPSEIRILDLQSGRAACLGPGMSPSLSPDGRWVALERVEDAFDLHVVDLHLGRAAVIAGGSPYPFQARFLGARGSLVLVAGHLNPLARTGDCDLFRVDLELLPTRTWRPFTPAWEPASLQDLGSPPRPARVPGPVASARVQAPAPRASLWVAAWYRRLDGTLAPMQEQDLEGLEVYSRRLARMIDMVRERTGAPRVNLVCHCMGGLVARGALQLWRDGRHGFPDTGGAPIARAVQHVVTMATPVRGTSFLGLLRLARALRLPLYRAGFTRQSWDLTRGSRFLARVNRGEAWARRLPGDPAACWKPDGPDAPPFHHALTGDGWWVWDGAIPLGATRCDGASGCAELGPADEHAVLYETPEGGFSTGGGRGLVHVPEDVRGDRVTEDKSKALTAWILDRLEPDLPILFVHGSYLYRGSADLSWRVLMHRLTGRVPGWPARYDRMETAPDDGAEAWLLHSDGG